METLASFEQGALSVWVRESPLVFPSLLVAHALGMGVVVGINVLLAWRLIERRSRSIDIAPFVPVVWTGFAASLISGALLLAAYPAKALTNPVFYSKLALLAAGLGLFHLIRGSSEPRRPLLYAAGLLVVWFGSITTGRLLAYTHSVLLASHAYE